MTFPKALVKNRADIMTAFIDSGAWADKILDQTPASLGKGNNCRSKKHAYVQVSRQVDLVLQVISIYKQAAKDKKGFKSVFEVKNQTFRSLGNDAIYTHLGVGELKTGDGKHDFSCSHDHKLRQQPHDVHRVLLRDLVALEGLKVQTFA